MKKKKQNFSSWLLVFPFVFIFIYGLYHSVNEDEKLKANSSYTEGVIFKKYSIIKRGYYIHYTYKVEGKLYSSSQNIVKKNDVYNVEIGDRFEVKYALDNPEYSELLFNKRIEDE